MLDEFIHDNREEIIRRSRIRVSERKAPRPTTRELERGVPVFLTELTALLREMLNHGAEGDARAAMKLTVEAHARDALLEGITVGQVVHDYGDVCQVVTEIAVERDLAISAAEFKCFNCCLDEAIARAVSEYQRARESVMATDGAERLGSLAHELRNVLSSAMLSWDSIKRGVAPTSGSVGAMHSRSLVRLRDLIDGSLTEVRLDAAVPRRERVLVAAFVEEEEIAAMIAARAQGLELLVCPVDPTLVIDVDRQLLAGALANLLQNAFKFTRPDTRVTLRVTGTETRVYVEVEDECGGLPGNSLDDLFRPFEQKGRNRSGLGLGLPIARRAVEANGGELRVHNLPNKGCRFTIDLPRMPHPIDELPPRSA